jgi:hypothetical protein
MDPVRIVPAGPDDERLWRLVQEFTGLMAGLSWTLIGGLMVRVIEAEHGSGVATWTTVDLDAVVDIRADPIATEETSRRLMGVGFEPSRSGPGIVYRFRRADDVVDVLAPDHIGRRARLVTVPPDQTLQAVGTRQALGRSRDLAIDAGWGPFLVPVPTLIGAILLKARVVGSARESRRKHERDLARLLVLVRDPETVAQGLTHGQRADLWDRVELTDPAHGAWAGILGAEDGAAALEILAGLPSPRG